MGIIKLLKLYLLHLMDYVEKIENDWIILYYIISWKMLLFAIL